MNVKKFSILLIALILIASYSSAIIEKASIPVYAVTSTDEALKADLTIEIVPGTGRVWTSVEPLVGTSTQHTARVSVELAHNYFDHVDDYDYKFDINSNASVVEGPSAGAAMSLLLISMLQDKPLPGYVAVTGQIAEDGSIGSVGGVFEKAKKASETGIKIFLVPIGEAYQMHRFPDGVKTVHLPEFALSEWSLKVIEVKNIDETLEFAFTKPENIDVNKQTDREPELFVPEEIIVSEELQPMKVLTGKYLEAAKEKLEKAKEALNNSPINDSALLSVLLDSLESSSTTIKRSELLCEKNYLYSSANFSFLAAVNAELVRDLSENPSLIEPGSSLLEIRVVALGRKIAELEEDLNTFYSGKNLEWIISAKQRLSWAKLNIKKLSGTKTIVVGNGSSTASIGIAIEELRDYEYASEWLTVAQDFFDIALESDDKIVPFPLLTEKSEEYIVAAENESVSLDETEAEDVLRRLDSAKLARQSGWSDSAAFDAASALALAKAEKAVKGKTLSETMSLLSTKLTQLKSQISSSGKSFIWGQLYFDHAKYFHASAGYFSKKQDVTNALDNAKAGLRLAFFAEEMINVTKQAQQEFDAHPFKQDFTGQPKIQLPEENSFYAYITILLVAASIIFLLAMKTRQACKPSHDAFISNNVNKIEMLSRQAEKARMKNQLSEEEFKNLSKEYKSKLNELEKERTVRSKHLIEMDKLHGEIEMIQFMLKELKRQYQSGEIVEGDYTEVLNSLSKRLASVKTEAGHEENVLSRENQKISRIKNSMPLKKSKK